MPLDKFVLILVVVVAAAGLTVWLGVMAAAAFEFPGIVAAGAIPLLLVAYVVVRVIVDRMRNAEDDRYDDIEK